MRFRWTIKNLTEMIDKEILRGLVVERQSDCTNIYAPLHVRLSKIYSHLNEEIEIERKKNKK